MAVNVHGGLWVMTESIVLHLTYTVNIMLDIGDKAQLAAQVASISISASISAELSRVRREDVG